VDGLLESVVKFSNYITARLVVAGGFFYVMAGFLHLGNPAEGLLPNLDLIKSVVENYQTIFDILGVSEFAMLLIFFIFLTAIHITYIAFDRIGHYIPPAIVPLPGWNAIEDMTHSAFDILREARGEEHTDEENQRLFEFRRKLETIEAANEARHEDELKAVNAAFRISKTFIVFSLGAWLWAVISNDYTGDPVLLLVMLGFAAGTALFTTLAINRANYERIEELRTEVSHQLIGFTSIWCPQEYMDRINAALATAVEQRPTRFKVLMPVYGTLDAFLTDMRKWRGPRGAM
jgi:F0F1-type ATP synthase assembly protein I